MQYSWFSTKPARVNQSLHHVLLLAVDPVTQRHTQYAWRGRTLHPYIPYTRTAEWIPDRCKNPTMKLTIINSNTHNLQAWPFSPDYPAPGTALRTSQKTALNKVHVPVEMGNATMMAGLLSLHIHNHHRRHVFSTRANHCTTGTPTRRAREREASKSEWIMCMAFVLQSEAPV